MVSDDFADRFLQEMEKEVAKIEHHEVFFSSASYSYVMYLPKKGYHPGVAVSVTNKGVNPEEKRYFLLLSSNTDQIDKIVDLLEDGDQKMISALAFCLHPQYDEVGMAALVLCYDFVNKCPYVEYTKREWINED